MRRKVTTKTSRNKRPVLGITLGDPAGIGPEVIAKALADTKLRHSAKFIIIGDEPIFKRSFKRRYPECQYLDLQSAGVDKITPAQPSIESAKAALAYLQKSVDLIKQKTIDAIVTGPLSKEAISQVTGKPFQGHTEFLAEAFHVINFDMLFVGGPMRTVVVTRHMALSQVPQAISSEKILQTITLTNDSLKKLFKISHPRIAVCGLNPHAGEGGKMGREEIEKITPAIQLARQLGIDVQGPFPADTLFCPDISKNFDVVVAMYHDQGIIPVKAVAFNSLVNMTIGLPFIRTSPAHGTAFNIAGKNQADPDSMKSAIQLAAQLAHR